MSLVWSKIRWKNLVEWFGMVLWHINNCSLFNAKSIFIHINNSTTNN